MAIRWNPAGHSDVTVNSSSNHDTVFKYCRVSRFAIHQVCHGIVVYLPRFQSG
jgi:hypothetical protein